MFRWKIIANAIDFLKANIQSKNDRLIARFIYFMDNVRGEFAFNDFVIDTGEFHRMIKIAPMLMKKSDTYRADGLIFAPPTGSTPILSSGGR
jgi:NAD kinase